MKASEAVQQDLDFHWQRTLAAGAISLCIFEQLHPQHRSLPLSIRHEFYAEGSDTGPHHHRDFYALYVVQAGRGVHVINTHPYGITRGDVYLLPPGTEHAYRDYCSLAVDAFYFQPQLFLQEELAALRALAGFWRLLITLETADHTRDQPPETLDHRLHLPPERHHELEATITDIITEYIQETPEAALLARCQFFRMLVHLARWQASIGGEKNERSYVGNSPDIADNGRAGTLYKAEITAILQFCEEHFHEALTVPQLAAYTFLSPGHFSELFSREVGVSPAAYIRRLRLERAQTLLRTTTLSTTTIAHEVGFRDSAQLSRTFRAVFHLAPTEYRARFR